ncbi:MAG: GGDEF domain-containing protein, partial [Clostridiales bacterium]|nr:GGDEF domain-containing protein [Clostridiales bacterium]
MNDRNQRERREQQNKVILFLAVVIMLALLIETMILVLVSNRNSNRTSTVLLNQVINILQENEKSEQELIDSLKTEYIVRAQSVAYFLDANPSAEQDIFELLKLARMMNLDEIHLFNKQGVIYGGTEPKYFGIGMDDGEQIGYFKPMLTDRTLSMCQDVTPNTAEGKSMMYAITWDATGEKMIQVGIEPLRLLEKLENNKISAVVDRMPAYQGMNIYVADVN